MTLLITVLAAVLLCAVLSYNKGFVEDWKEALQWYSTWAFTTIATIQGSVMVYLTPTQLEARILFLPTWTYGEVVQAVITFLALTGLWGRLISQKKKPAADPDVVVE